MRFLGRAAFVVFLLFGVLIAVSNRQQVELGLWPLAETISMPLFVRVPVLLLLGLLAGFVLAWFAGAGTRRSARQHRREAERLNREAAALREELAGERHSHEANTPANDLPGSERRSLERQAALVDPDHVVTARRIGRRDS